jgi:hypothetical protein
MPDPRQCGKVTYPLDEVLLLCLLAVLAGAETFVDIARFRSKKLALLRRFRPFRDGIQPRRNPQYALACTPVTPDSGIVGRRLSRCITPSRSAMPPPHVAGDDLDQFPACAGGISRPPPNRTPGWRATPSP